MKKQIGTGLVLSLLTGCGSDRVVGPSPPPPPSAAPCSQTSVFGPAQGSLPTRNLDMESFSTSTTGRVDVFLDWTLADSPMGVYVVQGSCNLDQFNARTCNFIARSEPPGPKPRRISADNVSAGSYTLMIGNFAAVDESVSTQVWSSSSGCPAFTTAPPSAAGEAQAVSAKVGAALRR